MLDPRRRLRAAPSLPCVASMAHNVLAIYNIVENRSPRVRCVGRSRDIVQATTASLKAGSALTKASAIFKSEDLKLGSDTWRNHSIGLCQGCPVPSVPPILRPHRRFETCKQAFIQKLSYGRAITDGEEKELPLCLSAHRGGCGYHRD